MSDSLFNRRRMAAGTILAAGLLIGLEAGFARPQDPVPDSEVSAQALDLSPGNLDATFDALEADGLSGVVSIALEGTPVYERALGTIGLELGEPVALDTVFGIGSRPIDFTVAAVSLLEQAGRLSRLDTIGRFIEDVPADKASMTVGHLLTGRSGLPDFFHTADDWDPDLAWLDRATAEERLIAAPLQFAPGTSQRHSHAAFGLLAAIVERVSGETYRDFVREHLLAPAGMNRTGFNGETLGLGVRDFAAGSGPSSVGLPNIPPNWGPTSWLVMGSGGMYSTLGDLQRFYRFVRSGTPLDESHAARFRRPFVLLDGSDRGFELFHAYVPGQGEAILLVNRPPGGGRLPQLFEALERLIEPAARPTRQIETT